MTSSIDKLFNYMKTAHERVENLWKNQFLEDNPEMKEELFNQTDKVWEELFEQTAQLSKEIEKEIIELKKAGQDINPYINLYGDESKVSLLDFIIDGFLDSSLLQYFEASDIKDPDSIMMTAFVMNRVDAINWLIDKLPVNTCDPNGRALIHLAVMHNDPEIVALLLERGANVNIQDDYANIALHYARSGEITKLLLEHGANPNHKNWQGNTPLHQKLWLGFHLEVAQALLEGGADINLKNDDGYTPLHEAILKKNLEATKFLVTNNADINAENNFGVTPLEGMFECRYKEPIRSANIDLEILEFLIANGADINRFDSKTWNPLKKIILHKLDNELVQNKVILLLTNSRDIKIDLESYPVRQFFTDENNIKAIFAVDGYEKQKAIAKANLLKNLQDYSQTHNDQKVLDIVQLVEQEIDLSTTEIAEDNGSSDQLDYKTELSGNTVIDTIDAA
ncbi:ankyrin repeat domain-containing protein [Candidatus Phycorickettsia trachydisci]|nr:ankyrin repeat domain-containing protein [Candidatus Phycorickettsia trachydisci]